MGTQRPGGSRSAAWIDLGEGHFQTSFRILESEDPTSFRQFPVDTGEATNFIADWGA